MVDTMMKSNYFSGCQSKNIIYECCFNDCYYYLALIIESRIKNKVSIVNGINFQDSYSFETPLMELVQASHCSNEYLQLLLYRFGKITEFEAIFDLEMRDKKNKTALEYCLERKNTEWIGLLKGYHSMSRLRNERQQNATAK